MKPDLGEGSFWLKRKGNWKQG